MVLLLELCVELVRIAVVQINQCSFCRALIHLTQAAARSLQHHVFGAISLLRENNAGQAAAIPAFFSNLNKENHTDFRQRLVKRVELHLAIYGLGVLLIAFVKFKNRIAAQTIR